MTINTLPVVDATEATRYLAGINDGQTASNAFVYQNTNWLEVALVEGRLYTFTRTITMDNNEIADIGIIPVNGASFLGVSVVSSVGADSAIFEDSDFSSGTAVDELAINRESISASGYVIVYAPTIVSDGNQLGDSQGERRSADDADGFMVPDRTKKYLLRITSLTNDNLVTIKITVVIK